MKPCEGLCNSAASRDDARLTCGLERGHLGPHTDLYEGWEWAED